MKLSGKKLTTAILAGLMGATMFGGSVFAAVTDQEFNEVRQGVNSNTQRISQLENAQSAAKDYSKDIAANKTAITDETTARTEADKKLQSSVDANAKAIDAEVTARDQAVAQERADRKGADAAQDKVIKQVNDNLVSSVDTINKNIGTITDQLNKNDLAEAQTRAAADKTLQGNIDAEATARDQAVAQERAERKGADAAQDKVIKQVNDNLVSSVNTINKNIGTITDQLNKNDLAEAQARDAADQTLQKNIDAETTARQTDVANLQKNITDSLTNQGKINETLTTAVQNNSKAIVDSAKNLEKHLSDTDGRVDKANAEIHTNAGNIAQSQKDIADIQDTLKNANAFASADATKAANEAAEKANTVANGLKDRVDLISNNQNVTSESDLIKKDQSVGQNLTNVDKALHKEISDRQAADDKLEGDMKKNLGIIQSQQDEQDNKIADHENRITANAGNIQKNKDAIKVNSDKLANHEDRITTNESNIERNAEAIKKETNARIDEDKKLQGNIDAEATARDAADQKLQGNIDAEAKARDAADQKLQGNIDAEATARADKDTAHDTAIAANKKAIGDEAAARQADVSRLDNKIHDVSKEVDTVGALSMAMSGLHPLSYDEGDARFQLSAAVGTYDGTEALALGGFYHFNRDSMLSVGVATDLGADEHRMGANVGYTRRIGQGGHVSRPSEGTVSDIMKDIKNLEQKQAKLEQENEQLKQQLAALKK